MLTPTQAADVIAERLTALPSESCPLETSSGRVLRENLFADRDVPPFDRVAMDGIAIVYAEYVAGRRAYRHAGIVAAGAQPCALPTIDSCLEVMTGAVLPPGTDAVIPVEDIQLNADSAVVLDTAKVTAYGNVHRQGSDLPRGTTVLNAGAVLRGPERAIAASIGALSLQVSREPRITIISTGDELVAPNVQPLAWQIRRSNTYAIDTTLQQHGYSNRTLGHLRDDPHEVRAGIAQALQDSDVLILSGGVSAGRFDYVPAALQELGVECVFHKVAQRPGKPLWFGVREDGKTVFALPGNPVSTLICLVRYVLPALNRLRGATCEKPSAAPLSHALENRHNLTLFMPVDRLQTGQQQGMLKAHATHGSGDFVALAGTVGFIEMAPNQYYEAASLLSLHTW